MTEYRWKRHRFKTTSAADPRPVKFPPPGPWWCSGYAGDDSYAIVIAFLPRDVELTEYWPEAYDDEFRAATSGTYVVFARPLLDLGLAPISADVVVPVAFRRGRSGPHAPPHPPG